MAIEDKVWQMLLENLAARDKLITAGHLENREDHTEIKTLLKEQNGRVKKLETWRSGICAVGLFIASAFAVVKWLWKPGV